MNVITEDRQGRKTVRVVPDGSPKATWTAGIELGPPDLSGLGFPEEVTTRLNNELVVRGIIRSSDARYRRADIHAALMSALQADANRIIELYEESPNG